MKKGIRVIQRGYKMRDNLSKCVEELILGHEMFEVAFRGAKLTQQKQKLEKLKK